jgi:hypothetical protein
MAMKRDKTALFIERARRVHGDRYDYSRVEYKKAIIKVDIVCKEHGVFRQLPQDHLRGRGCRACGSKRRAIIKTYTTGSFIEKASLIHRGKYNYSEVDYKKSNIKISILCDVHGLFLQMPAHHLQGQGCPKCGGISTASKRRLSKSGFTARAKKIHRDRYDYSKVKYKNNSTKVLIICKKHGVFNQRPSCHLQGKGCPKCGDISMAEKNRIPKDVFVGNARSVHGDIYDYSIVRYIKAQSKVSIICKKHGVFKQVPNSHLRGSGCPACSGTVSTNDFINKAKIIHGDRYDYSGTEWESSRIKVLIKCKFHGPFYQTPGSHLQGRGCSGCKNSGWTLTAWRHASKKSKYFTGFKLYLILCDGDGESFLKVGRTFYNVNMRFSGSATLPYEYTLISKIAGTAKHIYNLEKEAFRIPNLKRYQPKKSFGGETECIDISELDRLKKWFEKNKKARLQSSNKQESQLRLF